MKRFKVKLGLGRMASHHVKEYEIDAKTENEAASIAKAKYYPDVYAEIGRDAPIFGKILTVWEVNEI